MFYLYIDEVFISSYHFFSEIDKFIFDYFTDIVESGLPFKCSDYDNLLDDLLLQLVAHQYASLYFMDHSLKVCYGNS